MKSLEIPLLLACSGHGTHCVAAYLDSRERVYPFLFFLVDRDGGAANP